MAEQTPDTDHPTGFAADAAPAMRPGVPREREARDSGAWWERPEQQHGVEVLSKQGLRALTPVFGTGPPPRLLSGFVRRLAYHVPEHRTTRWALLLIGDRLDVLEHRLARNVWMLPAALALGLGYRAVARRR